MRSFITTLLVCSVTMSALALFYLAITPFISKRCSEKGRYYAWLIIVAGLLIPFRPQFGNAIVTIDIPNGTTTPAVPAPELSPVTAWWRIAAAVWLTGLLVFCVYHAVKHYHFVKMAKRWSESVTDERTLALLQSMKTEMGISRQISLYQCLSMGNPTMFGFVHPRIILPAAEPEEDELRFILKHELIHYKRKDLFCKCLILAATAVHWFNPFVYLIAKAAVAQCELSCDAEIVRGADADTRQRYSEAIISVVRYNTKLQTALSTNFYGGKKGMKNRISSIMDTSKKNLGFAIIGIILAATVCTGFAFAANAYESDTDDGATYSLKGPDGLEIVIANPREASVFERGGWKDADMTFSTSDEDCAVLAGAPFDHDAVPAPRVYTDDEWARIIADIESGKIQPAGKINPDGTMEIYDLSQFCREGAERAEVSFYDGEDCIGSGTVSFGD